MASKSKREGVGRETIHQEGRSYSDETILQVVELNKDERGNLHSIALSATIAKHKVK